MKKIIYLLAIVVSAIIACKKTTGLTEKNTVSPNLVDTTWFKPKASYVLEKSNSPRYIPCTVTATNTSILADSSIWCFIKNGKYVVVSRERNFTKTYTAVAKDTLVLIVKNKAGQADTNTAKSILSSNDKLQHIITVSNRPTGAQIKEITIDALPLSSPTKVFIAIYHNGNRIDNFIYNSIGEGWDYSVVKTIQSANTISASQLPYKFPIPQNIVPFRFSSVTDTYTFKLFNTDINGTLIDEATIKIEDNFSNGVPDISGPTPLYPNIPTFVYFYAKNPSGTTILKLKFSKWY